MNLKKYRYLIASIPKSGTYLVAEILEGMGLMNTHWHITYDKWQDYAGADLEEMRKCPQKFTHSGKAKDVAMSIPLGSFAATHAAPKAFEGVPDLKVIFVYRNLREVLLSWHRFILRTRRWTNANGWMDELDQSESLRKFIKEHGESVASELIKSSSWKEEDSACKLIFTNITGQNGEASLISDIGLLCDFLSLNIKPEAALAIVKKSQASDTLTKTSDSERRKLDVWDSKIEDYFVAYGLKETNRHLGFSERLINMNLL